MMYGPEPVDDVAENIMNERMDRPVDRNPSMDCICCDSGYRWGEYWQDRIDTPNDLFICDACWSEIQHYRKRVSDNTPLDEFI